MNQDRVINIHVPPPITTSRFQFIFQLRDDDRWRLCMCKREMSEYILYFYLTHAGKEKKAREKRKNEKSSINVIRRKKKKKKK